MKLYILLILLISTHVTAYRARVNSALLLKLSRKTKRSGDKPVGEGEKATGKVAKVAEKVGGALDKAKGFLQKIEERLGKIIARLKESRFGSFIFGAVVQIITSFESDPVLDIAKCVINTIQIYVEAVKPHSDGKSDGERWEEISNTVKEANADPEKPFSVDDTIKDDDSTFHDEAIRAEASAKSADCISNNKLVVSTLKGTKIEDTNGTETPDPKKDTSAADKDKAKKDASAGSEDEDKPEAVTPEISSVLNYVEADQEKIASFNDVIDEIPVSPLEDKKGSPSKSTGDNSRFKEVNIMMLRRTKASGILKRIKNKFKATFAKLTKKFKKALKLVSTKLVKVGSFINEWLKKPLGLALIDFLTCIAPKIISIAISGAIKTALLSSGFAVIKLALMGPKMVKMIVTGVKYVREGLNVTIKKDAEINAMAEETERKTERQKIYDKFSKYGKGTVLFVLVGIMLISGGAVNAEAGKKTE